MTKKRFNISVFLTGFIGYFVGAIIYILLGGENRIVSYFSSIIFASIIGVLYYVIARKKHYKNFEKMDSIENDERGRLIRGKTSSYTLILIMFLSLGLFIFSVLENQSLVSTIIGVSYIISIVFNTAINFYLNRKI